MFDRNQIMRLHKNSRTIRGNAINPALSENLSNRFIKPYSTHTRKTGKVNFVVGCLFSAMKTADNQSVVWWFLVSFVTASRSASRELKFPPSCRCCTCRSRRVDSMLHLKQWTLPKTSKIWNMSQMQTEIPRHRAVISAARIMLKARNEWVTKRKGRRRDPSQKLMTQHWSPSNLFQAPIILAW